MKGKLIKIATIAVALVAFAPVLAVAPVIEAYATSRAQADLAARSDGVARQLQESGRRLITIVSEVISAAPALCTIDYLKAAREAITAGGALRSLVVEAPGQQSGCTVGAADPDWLPLADPLTVAGTSERLTLVSASGSAPWLIRVAQNFGSRTVVAYGRLPFSDPAELAAAFPPGARVEISLADGTPAVTVGPQADWGRSALSAESFAGNVPFRVTATLPVSVVLADSRDATLVILGLTVLLGGFMAYFGVTKVRGTRWPMFDLERAVRNGEIKPYYQPVVNVTTGRITGCEVLCRWEHRDGSVRGPGSFIEYAESTGLGIGMTQSLMRQVREDLDDLCRELPTFTVSINLFDKHFVDNRVVSDVAEIFAEGGVTYRQLVFEITERNPLDRVADAHEVIVGLHQLGCRVAMDDTGTGHSNLAYLQTLGVDVLKIDRIFVDMILPGTTSVPVLDGLIRMARDLNTDIVAEGVETEEQLQYLRARGVTDVQGYLFSPALAAPQFCRLARALNPESEAAAAGTPAHPGTRPASAA